MANKALAKRQKMTIRVEPSQRPLKGRNVVVAGVKQKAAQSPESKRPGESVAAKLLSKVLGKTGAD
jgi:hypothetical protein